MVFSFSRLVVNKWKWRTVLLKQLVGYPSNRLSPLISWGSRRQELIDGESDPLDRKESREETWKELRMNGVGSFPFVTNMASSNELTTAQWTVKHSQATCNVVYLINIQPITVITIWIDCPCNGSESVGYKSKHSWNLMAIAGFCRQWTLLITQGMFPTFLISPGY